MTRKRSFVQAMAALASILVFGLMLTAAGRLLLGGPVLQKVVRALPFEAAPAAAPMGETDRGATGGPELEPPAPEDRTLPSVASLEDAPADLAASTAPQIALSKRRVSPDPAGIGETVEFVIELRNSGSLPLSGVYLADAFDVRHLAYERADPPPTAVDPEAGTLTWSDLESLLTDGSFDPGETIVIAARFEALAETPLGEPARNSARAGARERNVSDGPAMDHVRILTPATLCLGDLVFVEMGDDGRFDPSQGDLGVAGVSLTLHADSDGDGALSAADQPLASTVTDEQGHYRFCELSPGDYLVSVEASNFGRAGPLDLLVSSRGGAELDRAADPDDDVDGDDNGAPSGPRGIVASRAIELVAGAEPGPEVDGDDRASNRTLDFGFVLARGGALPPAESLVDEPRAEPAPSGEQPPAAELLRRPQMPRTGRAPLGKPVRYEGPLRGK